ncbi:hypothetical protein GYMLUDRAFT_252389 [Collybiopsis luxurians FD-317 M1]|uniref:Uncharacterized protein n=1 Tax=Collybiopsis luxurians FD-317 M1 TaxID=944289 RepID=A0A0D0BNL8_9AGAR|nr:hypothetical protein GYMLUDRAFT_252389 [Collybiopsis luxurians FD-317 M1]
MDSNSWTAVILCKAYRFGHFLSKTINSMEGNPLYIDMCTPFLSSSASPSTYSLVFFDDDEPSTKCYGSDSPDGATCCACGWTNAHAPNCPFKS